MKWEVVSGNIITIDATPPVESASYETQRTVDLVFKLKQLPALQSVRIIPATGHVEEFCPFSGGGDVYMFAKDLVVFLLTVEEDKDDDDNDCEDDSPSPQAQQEKENTPVPPPLKRELRCSGIEYKVKPNQSNIAVRLQLQANMLLASITSLKEVVDRDPTTASTVTLITCYGVIIGPYPVVLLQSIIDFSSGTLIYMELCNQRRNACHFAWIDSVLAHVVQKLLPV